MGRLCVYTLPSKITSRRLAHHGSFIFPVSAEIARSPGRGRVASPFCMITKQAQIGFLMQIATRAQLALSKAWQFALANLFIFSITIILGAGLGFLISRGDYLFAFGLVVSAPLVVVFISHPFIGVGIWLVLMPLSSALPNQEQLVYWVIHRILITLTLCVSLMPWLARSFRLPRLKLGPPEVCMAIIIAYVPISVLLSDGNLDALTKGYFNNILIPILLYLFLRLSVLDQWKQQLLQWTALFIVLSQCIIGLMSWLLPGILPSVWLHYFQTRLCGSLLNPNTYAVVLVFCTLILFHSAMNRRPGLIRSGFLLTCGLSALCIFLTMERAVWLGTAAVVFGLVILYPRPMLRYIMISGVIIAIIGAGLLSEKIAMASSRLENQANVDIRIVVTDAMFQMIQVKPVFGWGYGTINQNIGQYYRQVDSFVLNKSFYDFA